MKKFIFIIIGIILFSSDAFAAIGGYTCSSLGLGIGSYCGGTFNNKVKLGDLCCGEGTCSCYYYECDGECWCTQACPIVCDSGKYWTGSACVACPNYTDGNGGASSVISSNSPYGITNCYVPSSSTINDNTGSFNFTSSCNYKN